LSSLVITLSLSMRVQTLSVLTKALSLPLNATAAFTRPWMPSTGRHLSHYLTNTPLSFTNRLLASSTPGTTSLSLVAASLVLQCILPHLSSPWLAHYNLITPSITSHSYVLTSTSLHLALSLTFFHSHKADRQGCHYVRRKKSTVRGKGGLAHGTGRVKPNSTIRRSDSNSSQKSASEPASVEPLKQRPLSSKVQRPSTAPMSTDSLNSELPEGPKVLSLNPLLAFVLSVLVPVPRSPIQISMHSNPEEAKGFYW